MYKIPEPKHVWADKPSAHHYGHEWLTHFNRVERHRLVGEDRRARRNVFTVLISAISFGLLIYLGLIVLGYL